MKKAALLTGIVVLILGSIACNLLAAAPTPTPTYQPLQPTAVPTLTLPAPATVSPSSTPAARLTAEILRNASYTLPVSKKTVQLKDGRYQAGSGVDFVSVGMADSIAFGDLNGDGVEDAAVVLGENTGGSGDFESVIVMLNQNGKPVQAGEAQIGDRVGVKGIAIQDQRIRLDLIVQGPKDPLCCPTVPVTETYALRQPGLILTHFTSKTPDGSERSLQIDGFTDQGQGGGTVQVKGRVTVSPFENTLAYRIYDEGGNKLAEGSLPVQSAGTGGPGTFNESIDLSKVPAGSQIRLEIAELSPADGSYLAMDSVEFKYK